MMSRTCAILMAACVMAAPAAAQNAYVTGSFDPWGVDANHPGSPDAAMNRVFGAGNWTKTAGFTTDIFTGNSFVYLDGGDGSGVEDFFVNGGGRAALEAFVLGGGRAFVNAARNDTLSPFEVGFGLTLTGENYSFRSQMTPLAARASLNANGAGRRWTGDFLSHDAVSCAAGAACQGATNVFLRGENLFDEGTFIDILAGGQFGAGYLLVGGFTPPFFHQPADAAAALRSNKVAFAASGGTLAVPEPASWAMLIAGFGITGATMRRRRRPAIA